MNGFMHPYAPYGISYGMLLWWIPLLVIAYLVYQDAEKRGMNGLLWFILVIIPMVGLISLILYLIVRESRGEVKGETSRPLEILKERYARGEICDDEYRKMKEELEG